MTLKKKIRNVFLAVWTIIGLCIILSVALCDSLSLSQAVITTISRVYMVCAIPVYGTVHILSRK